MSASSPVSATDCPQQSPTILRRWVAGAAAAGAAAIVGVTVAVASGSLNVKGEARSAPAPAGDAPVDSATAAQLQQWLISQGADVSKVQIKVSQAGPGAGLGLFATVPAAAPRHGSPWWSWLWPWRGANGGGVGPREPTTLASFPLATVITARTACRDPQLGEQFSWMVDKHLLDERTAVMVYILIERLRGDGSRYAPWIRALPRTFDVPLAFSEEELRELRGTALYRATAAVSRRMRDSWTRLEAPLGAVARELGLPAPQWEDWVWAYCVFWSRGQSLPVPEKGSASSALVAHSSATGDKIQIQILEGLVPGLDFCNHRQQPPPQCWWEVVAPERPTQQDSGASGAPSTSSSSSSGPTLTTDGPMVRLQLHAEARVRSGDELFISYGDKSNEELLMLYGFALKQNPHDHLMLFCPLPPQAEWDDVMHARMELLQAYGLRPQFFLPHPDQVVAAPGTAGPRVAGTSGQRPAATPAAKKTGSVPPASATSGAAGANVDADAAAAAASSPPLVLPGDVLDTLEVFVLNFQELAVRSKALQAKMAERRASRAAGAPLEALSQHSPRVDIAWFRSRFGRMTAAELRHHLQVMGLRMATLTTFIRLLEVKVFDLEGPEGTGPLEDDQQLLASRDREDDSRGGLPAEASWTWPLGAVGRQQSPDPQHQRRLRAAVVYRMGQKQLARAWLVRAKGELQSLLGLMRDMQARQEALDRAAGSHQ